MAKILNKSFDEERALYGSDGLELVNCKFDGAADGESALKEAKNINAEKCFFNLRYPLWHDNSILLSDCTMTELCRAALWYSKDITIKNTAMHGIKALRECENVVIVDCDIVSPEFGWSVQKIKMENSTAKSEYFMLRSENIEFNNVRFSGKYSFQYIKNAVFDNCVFDTKDAFWHSQNVTVKNSVVNGEYLAWYSDSLTLENCKITGTQPFCYCNNLRLIDCEMENTDLCFEKSAVNATITSEVDSIKNPLSGEIFVPAVGEIIRDDESSKGRVYVNNKEA